MPSPMPNFPRSAPTTIFTPNFSTGMVTKVLSPTGSAQLVSATLTLGLLQCLVHTKMGKDRTVHDLSPDMHKGQASQNPGQPS
jgi:hypothetical protein